jgi:hypothetical protein
MNHWDISSKRFSLVAELMETISRGSTSGKAWEVSWYMDQLIYLPRAISLGQSKWRV